MDATASFDSITKYIDREVRFMNSIRILPFTKKKIQDFFFHENVSSLTLKIRFLSTWVESWEIAAVMIANSLHSLLLEL